MPKLPDDQWPTDDPVLASFAEDLRIVASGPAPEPRPGLVAAMRQGPVLVDSPETAGRKKMLVKTLLGGLVAKLAMGVGVATASVAAAGAAGVLPDPAQNAVASIVAAATPFNLPEPSDVTTLQADEEPGGSTTTTSTTSVTTTTLADGDDDGDGTDTGTRAVNHGLCVSTAAQDKSGEGNHGKTVSSVARSDCGKTTTTVAGGSTTTTTGGGSTTTTMDDGQRSGNSGPGNSGNSGRGNSGNSGSGNSGRGNSGNAGNSGNSGRN